MASGKEEGPSRGACAEGLHGGILVVSAKSGEDMVAVGFGLPPAGTKLTRHHRQPPIRC